MPTRPATHQAFVTESGSCEGSDNAPQIEVSSSSAFCLSCPHRKQEKLIHGCQPLVSAICSTLPSARREPGTDAVYSSCLSPRYEADESWSFQRSRDRSCLPLSWIGDWEPLQAEIRAGRPFVSDAWKGKISLKLQHTSHAQADSHGPPQEGILERLSR